MISTLLLGVGLLTAVPEESPPADLAAYERVKSEAGRGSEAQVKLALWCESHGLSAERVKHLALAVLTDPRNATARGLMGLVDYRGRWERPEAVSDKVKSDEELSAKLSQYNARRDAMPNTADAHWKLALWCEEAGLKPEARAHLATVTRLNPRKDEAWKFLGFKKVGHRWVADGQLAAEKAETDAQRAADQHWKPLLMKWRAWLHEKARKDQAEEALAGVTDPRAVPSIWAVFGVGDAGHQVKAVQTLGQIDSPESSRALAALAAYGHSPEVARTAAETLKRRDTRDYVDVLIAQIRDPLKYEVKPANGPGTPGELFVEGKKYNVLRRYGPDPMRLQQALNEIPSRLFDPSIPFDPYSQQNMAAANAPAFVPVVMPAQGGKGKSLVAPAVNLTERAAARDIQIADRLNRIQQAVAYSQVQLDNDVAQIEATNASIRQANSMVLPVLNVVTGQSLGDNSEAWQAWWTDQKGYAYVSDEPQNKPTLTTMVENPYSPVIATHHACFGAGTSVRTLNGLRAIETLKVGDQVLSQDTKTGRLSYTPVVVVYHNPPASALKVKVGDETVVATGIHRFWKAGQGWAMARDLKPGDSLRTLGGIARVESVESDVKQPVFNLEVADGQSYFVGNAGTLVHDNSLVRPETQPFDASPPVELAKRAD